MSAGLDKGFALSCHPATPCEAVRRLEARIERISARDWRLTYSLHADLGRLRVPQLSPAPSRSDELWRHTCFEAFIARADAVGYQEFNLAPSGAWAAYRFSAYRAGMMQLEGAAPLIEVSQRGDLFVLDATIGTDVAVDDRGAATPARVALAAVLEGSDGVLSYWALRHPAAKPDFHHPDSFELELS